MSNEILEEYEEIIARKTNRMVATNVIQMLLNSPFVCFVTPYYHFHLIDSDKDDNKFVDCAIAANATLVTEDSHFNILKEVRFPQVELLKLKDFQEHLLSKRADT